MVNVFPGVVYLLPHLYLAAMYLLGLNRIAGVPLELSFDLSGGGTWFTYLGYAALICSFFGGLALVAGVEQKFRKLIAFEAAVAFVYVGVTAILISSHTALELISCLAFRVYALLAIYSERRVAASQ